MVCSISSEQLQLPPTYVDRTLGSRRVISIALIGLVCSLKSSDAPNTGIKNNRGVDGIVCWKHGWRVWLGITMLLRTSTKLLYVEAKRVTTEERKVKDGAGI